MAVAVAATVASCATTAGAAEPLAPLAPDTPVARVGATTIDFATLERWGEVAGSLAASPGIAEGKRLGIGLSVYIYVRAMPVEAERVGLVVPPARVTRAAWRFVRQLGLRPREAALMLRAGVAEDLLYRRDLETLPPLSDGELLRLWRRQREPGFFTPRVRRAEVVELRTPADADAALTALRAGESFGSVAARLAAPGAGAFRGDVQLYLADAGDHLTAVERAIFAASLGVVRGPVETRRGHAVLRVVEIVSERARRPLAQVRELLDDLTFGDRQARAYDRRMDEMSVRWRARTTCIRRITVSELCGSVVNRLSR